MRLVRYRAPDALVPPPTQPPIISSGSGRGRLPSPRPSAEHQESASSSTSRSRYSPPSRSNLLKLLSSPPPDDVSENKRTRVDIISRQSSGSGGRVTPVPSLRQSPDPFRIQPASRPPEVRQSSTVCAKSTFTNQTSSLS